MLRPAEQVPAPSGHDRRAVLRLGREIGLALLVAGTPAGVMASPPGGKMPLGLAVGIDALRWQDDAALAREFADYARLGVSWLRTDLNWSLVQATGPDAFDWAVMDRVISLSERHDIRVLPVLGSTPAWAALDPTELSPPRDVDDFARFAAAAVARYLPRDIRVWEIWNEPNMAGSWPPLPDPARYARLLIAAAAAIRAGDPGATVLLGGLAAAVETGPEGAVEHHAAVDFLAQVYAAEAGDAFDALAFHPYSHPLMPDDPAPWNGWAIMEGPLRDEMIRNGDGAKAIWITEYGMPTNAGSGGGSEARQSDMLRSAADLAAAAPWRAGPLFWYSYRDLAQDREDPETAFGLVRTPGDPKAAHATFRSLAAGRGQASGGSLPAVGRFTR